MGSIIGLGKKETPISGSGSALACGSLFKAACKFGLLRPDAGVVLYGHFQVIVQRLRRKTLYCRYQKKHKEYSHNLNF